MFNRLVFITIFLIICLCTSALSKETYLVPFGPAMPPYFLLERYCKREIAKGSTVGISVAVVENGKVEFIKSFGVREKNEPWLINNDTTFQIGSVSKPLSSSLFFLASKQKKIDLETPIQLANLSAHTIKNRHILSHTSGFVRHGWNLQIEKGNLSRSQLIDLLSKKHPQLPGKMFDYHNVVFSLIEESLHKALGMPFHDAMTKELFKPLGMRRTTLGFHQFKQQTNRAWPHEQAKNGVFPSKEYSYRYHDQVASSAGINSSINDMVKFLQLQLGHFPQLLTFEELALMHSPVCLAPDANRWFKNILKSDFSCHYGYGWRMLYYGTKKIVFHGGWLKGFAGVIAFLPKDARGIVILSNTESSFAFFAAMAFLMNELP